MTFSLVKGAPPGLNIISLGAGVQSSVMALMASELPAEKRPAFAVFADTMGEPPSVYQWLDWLEPRLAFPLHRVKKGPLAEDCQRVKRTKSGKRRWDLSIPMYVKSENGKPAPITRGCTLNYKIHPINRLIRSNIPPHTYMAWRKMFRRGLEPDPLVSVWLGISTDEASRMKPAREPWLKNRWPLIEWEMNRSDCLLWMKKNGFPRPPRSACYFCPFHSDVEWARLRKEEPASFQKAVEFERECHLLFEKQDSLTDKPFLHKSLTPLSEVDFSDADVGFDNECEGHCGI